MKPGHMYKQIVNRKRITCSRKSDRSTMDGIRMPTRKIIEIDEEKCDGCGLCIPHCAEGSLRIVNGKAELVSDNLCDGLGACLGHCPRGALRIIERDADEFDEARAAGGTRIDEAEPFHKGEHLACGCPSTQVATLKESGNHEGSETHLSGTPGAQRSGRPSPAAESHLTHWPVKLHLVPPGASFLDSADLLVLADCAAVSAFDLHETLLKGKAVVIFCPKFENPRFYTKRLAKMVSKANLTSITVAHMEVPCCYGLFEAVKKAVVASRKDIPLEYVIIERNGEKRTGEDFTEW